MKEEFYTQKRWLNWMNKVKDSNFKLTESDDKNSGAVFIYIMDDVVLACLKVIARFEREIISAEEALDDIEAIRSIVFQEHESLGEDADLMIESLKTSLAAVFVSSQRYITGSFDRESTLDELVARAVAAEEKENLDEAFDLLSQVGARVIGGENLPEIGELPYCMTAELMDGIDAISAAMIGDDSYKDEDGSEDTGEGD
ncbi:MULTISPECIES: DUF2150 family protein [Methanothrix]|jgi:hypothetical protein|uniref:DUF2150 family protein n=1 Tax=Methanothrix TaxID=2222 RepID=UPI00257F8CC8|nr:MULTISPECIES: DUF2150 family protein [Methanothrix]MDY0411586.1 DUF2150 family protein [Methanothrix soehngenii]HNQ52697.1 DUF2150 family protein [Methanothrix soehngenii]HPE50871.1 DUF2150 family protein [Methanothrix soehngenii]HRW32116.1 DUF2150 family protein [Methanothrix sp.]